MILIIDNYDSFTYNLVQYVGVIRPDLVVHRNDKINIDEIASLKPDRIIISPGPCTPLEAGISNDIIRTFGSAIPILGVCLGHQCIGYSYGGDVVRADRLMHGKTSMIYHVKNELFADVPNPFEATRYHSLIVKKDTLPDCLEITASTKEDEIMGLKHKEYPVYGVQFHPESILTREGPKILNNFLGIRWPR
ncbi:MAG: aminodeoxychorismate/anthranilate synthase component II [Candidatus Abyssobacteria bacterium SURF_17]|jgi:anthranilate synthase/aminodeoxychorismate synthase-like glutamine amidotransferase|uniref:Aminodeoxychorismate/anthranilate synthase component II n=1 Tax=Candidatus Abyssobacteria bacterium SURF_17 TaxID=2093361 RepID=A0A419F2V2_9BACT|nr:MAG: aminodeoxychorismate/anthranilate synthase component II [Candidatus Abyssubacteria bacterium SURF_17]